jgi:adenine-specific DNA-methyltransferase
VFVRLCSLIGSLAWESLVKGFVPTPDGIVDLMVGKLFAEHQPNATSRLLDPGCGNGEFIAGVLRICAEREWPIPTIVGVELEPDRAAAARTRFSTTAQVRINNTDFLQSSTETFDYIIGNPPYVSILALSVEERLAYRRAFRTASGRFDLYVLFFEQALRQLASNGRLVFITPEKFAYVQTAKPLRDLLRTTHVEELHFLNEDTFESLTTYPLISTIVRTPPHGRTKIVRRDGRAASAVLSVSSSWLPMIEGFTAETPSMVLADVAVRISCGVATGADSVFVLPTDEVPWELREFAHPTLSGRQITPDRTLNRQSSLLAPYDATGALLSEQKLGALGEFLREHGRFSQLTARSCVAHKPWYAFHDSLPLSEMRRPKLLCKDITESPFFVIDYDGSIVPRHSVYYVVPTNPADLERLAAYLNSPAVSAWLRAQCQRAAGGFLRLQSHVLKRIPVPASFAPPAAFHLNPELELRPA